jgi:hypothetical protein
MVGCTVSDSGCWATATSIEDVLGGALDYARWRKPRLGVTLRRHLRDHQPCPSNIPKRGLRFACAPRSPVTTGSDPLSTDLLVAGKASRPAVSQLATTHRRDQAHADEKRARGPASASDFHGAKSGSHRLSAGGSRIRTLSPTRGSGSLSAINLPRYRRPCHGRRLVSPIFRDLPHFAGQSANSCATPATSKIASRTRRKCPSGRGVS